MKFVDIFSGGGGLSLGLKWAGFSPLAAIDSSPSSISTYSTNFPEADAICADLRTMNGINKASSLLSDVDVLIGGPPCQGFSVANRKNGGRKHPGTQASWEFFKIIKKSKPEVFLMENVPGIKYMERGKIWSEILKIISKAGYHYIELTLSAKTFGVPQNRERIFLIGFKDNDTILSVDDALKDSMIEVFKFLGIKNRTNTVWTAISDLPTLDVGGGGSDFSEYKSKPATKYQKWARKGCNSELWNHWTTRSGEKSLKKIMCIPPGLSLKKIFSGLPYELRMHFKNPDALHSNIYRRLDPKLPSPTITHPRKSMLIHPYQHRVITVREAARLQSFPDSFIFKGGLHSQMQQVANAVPPLLAMAVGIVLRRLLDD